MMRQLLPTESQEQQTLWKWVRWHERRYPALKLLTAIPAGAHYSSWGMGGRMKAEGYRPGCPDLALFAARKGYHGLLMELKVGKGKLTCAQKAWMEALKQEDYYACVCYGWEAARDTLVWYLEGD